MAFIVRAGVLAILFALLSSFSSSTESQLSPQDQAWVVLRGGLEETKATKRAEAVKALSLLSGDRKAVRFALRALHDNNAGVRTAAAATLGQLHAYSAITALKEALSDKDISVVLASAHALLMLKDNSAYGIYYAILMGDKKSSEGMIQAQMSRQEGLGFIPFGGMGYEAYRTVKKHDSSPVRAAAARFLAFDPDPISEDALLQTALADKNEIVREAALDALAERGDPKCVERLLRNLLDDKTAVRYRTAATILRLSNSAKRLPGKK